jgi:hypothetical protein
MPALRSAPGRPASAAETSLSRIMTTLDTNLSGVCTEA